MAIVPASRSLSWLASVMNSNSVISEYIDRFLVPVDDPSSRLFHVNLALSAILILAWSVWVVKPKNYFSFFGQMVFRKKYWWNRSTKNDYKIYFINSLFKVFLFIPFLDGSYWISRNTAKALVNVYGDFANVPPTTLFIFLFTVFHFAWDDFLRFYHHKLMHRFDFLWKFHVTHHSAKILTPVTLFRTHPLESALATIRNSLSVGVSTGLFVFIFGSTLNLVTIFGINIFSFLFNLLGANLRHSHIPIAFPTWIEGLFISPKQHQIHHSIKRQHHDKNYGVSLALWDRINHSLIYSTEVPEKLSFGVKGKNQGAILLGADTLKFIRKR